VRLTRSEWQAVDALQRAVEALYVAKAAAKMIGAPEWFLGNLGEKAEKLVAAGPLLEQWLGERVEK
jgi:hypothetical protein